ncbi:hypothetical protein TNCV_2801061 [Trichonephila clavipes]|nr:hypothetical protein TNCV_2801061 [Trichonephila clavipes]
MPSITLRVHMEYVIVESVGSKVLGEVAAKTTIVGDWRKLPSPPVPWLNLGGGGVVSPCIVLKSKLSHRLW